jgi:hypothetical protein
MNLRKLLFLVAFLGAAYASAQRVQIIHNAPDPALRAVDIWVNGGQRPVLSNFNFRQATPFLDLGALGITGRVKIEIKPLNSGPQTSALLTKEIVLGREDTKYIIANGVANPRAFANPFGYNIAADLFAIDAAENAQQAGNYQFRLFHGVSDVPPVSVFLNNATQPIAPLLRYGQASNFISVPGETENVLRVRIPGQNATIAQLELNTRGKSGRAGIVLASGFAFPDNNNNGPFNVFFLVNPDGSTEIIPIQTAVIEILNNVSDPTVENLDFGLRNLNLNIETKKPNNPYLSTYSGGIGVGNTWQVIAYDKQGNVRASSAPFVAERNGRYRFMINGVVNLSNFDLSVNGPAIHINFYSEEGTREAIDSDKVRLRVVHAAPDVPPVNIGVRELGVTPFTNLAYGRATEFVVLPVDDYLIDIALSQNPNASTAFALNLSEWGGRSGIVFASGFANPSRNRDGAELGIYFWPEGASSPIPLYAVPASICDAPVDLRLEAKTMNSARVVWANMPSAVFYRVTYAKASDWETKPQVIYTSDNFFTFFDSLPNQEWKIAVNTICEDGNSSYPTAPLLVKADKVNCALDYNYYAANASCVNCADGAITITPYGGFAPYRFAIGRSDYTEKNVFTGLLPGTYTVFVKDLVGCLTQKEIIIDNTICGSPTNLGATFVTRNGAQLIWDVVPGAYQYEIKFWIQGEPSFQARYRSVPGINLNFLTPGRTYNAQVTAFCAGQASRPSFLQFNTLSGKGFEKTIAANENSLTIFPNPAKENIVCRYTPLKSGKITLHIIDIHGKRVWSQESFAQANEQWEQTIGISDFVAGLYILEVLEAGNRIQTKFQVR